MEIQVNSPQDPAEEEKGLQGCFEAALAHADDADQTFVNIRESIQAECNQPLAWTAWMPSPGRLESGGKKPQRRLRRRPPIRGRRHGQADFKTFRLGHETPISFQRLLSSPDRLPFSRKRSTVIPYAMVVLSRLDEEAAAPPPLDPATLPQDFGFSKCRLLNVYGVGWPRRPGFFSRKK
ncbi:hypothetical protein BDZ89DRAFT_1041871 [Hymenopellis radicata]|nr:hypothetical protein BDZ89DRAFT_1041871 [Hymenopellis radicata]